MADPLPELPAWRDVTRERFEQEILPLGVPAVLRGVVAGWPAVRHGLESPVAAARYLAQFDAGQATGALLMPPEEDGRIDYDATMSGFNFVRRACTVTEVLEQVLRYAAFERAPAAAIQSAQIATCLPGFEAENAMPLLAADVRPRLWFGTAIVTPAHFDESHNVACCVAGRRRFTLFPPEQVANLHVGPLEHTPAGMPMSLVDFARPDFERFPRFREALAHARVAELAPGDALYLPPLWWHHVQSLEHLNVLVNYWWQRPLPGHAVPPFALDALLHAAASLRGLPAAQREAWRHVFDHFVFESGDEATAHIPAERRGVLGALSEADHARVKALLVQRLGR